jgi:hypothetical protein
VRHYFSAKQHHVQGMVISMRDIIAFIQAAAANEHPVHSIGEGAQDKFQVDSTGTHDAYKPDFSCILQSGNSSHVSRAVSSPVAHKSQYFGLKFKSGAHSFSTPLSVNPAWFMRLLLNIADRRIDLAQEVFVGKVL